MYNKIGQYVHISPYFTMYIFIIDCVLITSSVLISILITITFIYDKHLLALPSNKFLVNFVIADFVVASGALVLAVSSKETDQKGAPLKFLVTSTYFIVAITSYWLSLMIVTIDRYIAIVYPLEYSTRISSSSACRIILAFWIFVVLFTISNLTIAVLLHANHQTVSKTLLVFLLVITFAGFGSLLFVNTIIFRQVRRQVKRLASISVDIAGEAQRTLKKRETKSAYLCFSMVATFVICWLPSAMMAIMRWENFAVGYFKFVKLTTTLFHANLVINPFLYVFWKSDVRCAMRRLFCRFQIHSVTANRVNSTVVSHDLPSSRRAQEVT